MTLKVYNVHSAYLNHLSLMIIYNSPKNMEPCGKHSFNHSISIPGTIGRDVNTGPLTPQLAVHVPMYGWTWLLSDRICETSTKEGIISFSPWLVVDMSFLLEEKRSLIFEREYCQVVNSSTSTTDLYNTVWPPEKCFFSFTIWNNLRGVMIDTPI